MFSYPHNTQFLFKNLSTFDLPSTHQRNSIRRLHYTYFSIYNLILYPHTPDFSYRVVGYRNVRYMFSTNLYCILWASCIIQGKTSIFDVERMRRHYKEVFYMLLTKSAWNGYVCSSLFSVSLPVTFNDIVMPCLALLLILLDALQYQRRQISSNPDSRIVC